MTGKIIFHFMFLSSLVVLGYFIFAHFTKPKTETIGDFCTVDGFYRKLADGSIVKMI